MSLNARNAFFVLQEAACRVVQNGGGRIIALSSWLMATNPLECGVYTALNAAVEAMVKALGKELEGTRITANYCISLWPVVREMFFTKKMDENNPIGRLGVPEDIGRIIGFLCSGRGNGSMDKSLELTVESEYTEP